MKTLSSTLSAALLLGACASQLPPPDWQANAHASLKAFTSAYLSGNTRLADFEFGRAKLDLSSTGRADLLARAELTRCAVRVASLEFDGCAAYQALAPEARSEEQAYAAFLNGHWAGLNAALLPPQHRALVLNSTTSTIASVLGAIEDPLARLVAAGALLQNQRLTPADIALATETASAQGWRRPLLAWLGVQFKRAQDSGNVEAAARLQRRMDLVLQSAPKNQ
jgi:hypothetical protein